MFHWLQGSFGVTAGRCRSPAVLLAALVVLATGCETVALSVDQPVGARVELYEKAKWFGGCGPDWGTRWNKLFLKTVERGNPCEMELEAESNWLDSAVTFFPRKYRACFDLSVMTTYPKTPSSMVEVRYLREVVPVKHQEIVRLWHAGRTLEALTRLPVGVLADVLYNLGDKFKGVLKEVRPAVQEMAAKDFKALLEAPKSPSPAEVESWLKSFLSKEQLAQICEWVREGVVLRDVKWVRLGGTPKHEDVPVFWRLIKDFVELFIRQPEIRSTQVDFLDDVILRHLMVKNVEKKLVNLATLKFYAEILTFDTTYYGKRAVPAIDLVQDIGLTDIVRPTTEQEEALKEPWGMTRTVELGRGDRAEAIRAGLPPVSLETIRVTSIRSQVIGALLEGEMAYVVIWNNPRETDPVRFLTTVITTNPYGMARVWALRGNTELCEATGAFDKVDAPLGSVAAWVVKLFDQRSLFIKFDKPLAVVSFGRRRLEPWSEMPRKRVSYVEPMRELEPGESAGD